MEYNSQLYQNRPKIDLIGPKKRQKMNQIWIKKVKVDPKKGQSEPKKRSRWTQNEPKFDHKVDQKWTKFVPEIVKSVKTVKMEGKILNIQHCGQQMARISFRQNKLRYKIKEIAFPRLFNLNFHMHVKARDFLLKMHFELDLI